MFRAASGIMLVAAMAFPAACKADRIGENFNELTPALNATNIGPFFTVTGGTVDIVGGALFGSLCVAPEFGNCLDRDGSNGTAGQISSAKMKPHSRRYRGTSGQRQFRASVCRNS